MEDLRTDKSIFEDILMRMDRLCTEVNGSGDWASSALAEGLNKDLVEIFSAYNFV